MTVDLPARTVVCGDVVATFTIDDYVAWRLENGLDDISLTLRHEDDITAFEAARPAWKPVVTPAVE